MILHSVAFKMGCFKDGHQDCAHVLSAAMFKVTLMCQNHNKTARVNLLSVSNRMVGQWHQFGNHIESVCGYND